MTLRTWYENEIHSIENNGKALTGGAYGYCNCFYRVSFEQNPNSGVYRIKIKIKYIERHANNMIVLLQYTKNKQFTE